jgi:hypothetical protein
MIRVFAPIVVVTAVLDAMPPTMPVMAEAGLRGEPFDQEVADVADARDEHDEQPDLLGVEERLHAGIGQPVPAVGQDGQDDDGDEREQQRAVELLLRDLVGELVELLLEREDDGRHDGQDDSGARVEERQAAHEEGQDDADLHREAEVRLQARGTIVGQAQQRHDRQQSHTEEEIAVLRERERRVYRCARPQAVRSKVGGHSTNEAGQPEGAQPGELDVGHLLLGDLALEAHHEPDGQGHEQFPQRIQR